jgi:hypothetical protein
MSPSWAGVSRETKARSTGEVMPGMYASYKSM